MLTDMIWHMIQCDVPKVCGQLDITSKAQASFLCHSTTRCCTAVVVPLCYMLFVVSVEAELSLTAWGQKLLCSLVFWQRVLLYCLSDNSSRVNRVWLEWVFLLVYFGLCAPLWYHWCSLGEYQWCPEQFQSTAADQSYPGLHMSSLQFMHLQLQYTCLPQYNYLFLYSASALFCLYA